MGTDGTYEIALRTAKKDLGDTRPILRLECSTCKRPRGRIYRTGQGLLLVSRQTTMEFSQAEIDRRNYARGRPLRFPELAQLFVHLAPDTSRAEPWWSQLTYLIDRQAGPLCVVLCEGHCDRADVLAVDLLAAIANHDDIYVVS